MGKLRKHSEENFQTFLKTKTIFDVVEGEVLEIFEIGDCEVKSG